MSVLLCKIAMAKTNLKNEQSKTKTKQSSINPKVRYNNEYRSIGKMSDTELATFLDSRYNKMASATIRTEQVKEWGKADRQWTALSVYDEFNNLQINLPLEKNLEDTYEGRSSGKLNFDIQPDGKQASVDELQPASYAMEFFLEWWNNRGSGIYDILPRQRRAKARYGTMFSFTGVNNRQDIRYKIKKGSVINGMDDLENQNNFEAYIMDMYEFFPTELDVKEIYLDEKCLGQPDIQKAEDMFIEKNISLTKIKNTRWNSKNYKNTDDLQADGEGSQSKPNDDVNSDSEAKIRFYYNAITKDYIVYAPLDKKILHKSKSLYNHGKLPIESCQHYTDIKSIYGVGIPKKIAYLKAYKTNIMQAILDNAAMGTWLNFIIWNSGTVEERDMGWDNINIRQSTWWVEQIQQMQPQANAGLVSILEILDDLVVQDTWENVRATIDMQSDKVWIVEMMEENKAVRHKSVDENWNLYLDRVLTMMLSNISQFAPSIGSKVMETEYDGDKLEKVQYPMITVEWAVVKQTNKWVKIIKEDNYWKYWYFELKPWLLGDDLGVKIVTPSSTSSLPLVRKANFDKWIESKLKMMEIASMDQSWKMMQAMIESISMQEALEWGNDVYWFEDKLKADTWKDKIKQKNLELVKKLREKMQVLAPNDMQNGQQTWQPNWQATQPPRGGKAIMPQETNQAVNPVTWEPEQAMGAEMAEAEQQAMIN